MNVVLGVTIGVLAVALAGLAARHRSYALKRPLTPPVGGTQRILFPFIASALSCRALDAALRLARAEDATLMPVFLASVPLTLPLDAALPRQSQAAIGLQEAIEQRASVFGVPVDARIERGRTYRHALRQTIDHERYQRIVVAAAAHRGQLGFGADDVAWLLDNAPGDIVVLRPGYDDRPLPIVQTDRDRLHRRPLAARPACDGGEDRAPATRTMISRGA
jgi:hypothetical protein